MKTKARLDRVKHKIFRGVALCAMFFAACPGIEAAEIARAQLDESERHLTNAHVYFMDQDYWNAIDQLNRALRANTYLVDFYLMNSLNLQRTGDLEDARKSLASYLEVRPMDPTAPRIMSVITEQAQTLRRVLSNGPLSARWRLVQLDPMKEWQSGALRPFSIKGMGKAESLGDVTTISDTYGDQVCIISNAAPEEQNGNNGFLAGLSSTLSNLTGSSNIKTVHVKQPVTTLPLGNGTFYIFNTSGDVYVLNTVLTGGEFPITSGVFTNVTLSPDLVGRLDSLVTATVSDAEWLSASEFAVSDPVARNIAFYDRQTLTPITTWTPPDVELEMLFEPVALDRYANWLAIADRGNNRVYILNLDAGMAEYFSINIALVRDVLWSPLGELFALTEHGDIFQLEVNFSAKTISLVSNSSTGATGNPIWAGLENVWAMFHSSDGGLYCIDLSGSKLWRATALPSQTVNFGFLSLYRPTLAMEANRESFLINATLTSPFTTYFQEAPGSIHCIWNQRSLNATTSWRDTPVLDAVLLHGPTPGNLVPAELRALAVNSGQDIRIALPPIWALHKGTLTNVILDSSIPFTFDELLNLACFCLMNGLELDIWARDIPTFAMTRASAITGGRTLYDLGSPLALAVPKTRMQIQIPLPEELSSSGYPSRSMLSVYLDIGLVQTRSWIPLWPDML